MKVSPNILALAVAGFVLAAAPAICLALSFDELVAGPGDPVHLQPKWPQGVDALVNDPLRKNASRSFFSGTPSDVTRCEMNVRTPADVNYLVRLLAAVKGERVQIHLLVGNDARPFMARKEGSPIGAEFSIGDQDAIDRWFERLPEEGSDTWQGRLTEVRAPGVWRPLRRGVARMYGPHRLTEPWKALPPTLTLYVGHEAIDLEKLEIPTSVDVKPAYSDAFRQGRTAEVSVEMIDQFVARHQAKQREAKERTRER